MLRAYKFPTSLSCLAFRSFSILFLAIFVHTSLQADTPPAPGKSKDRQTLVVALTRTSDTTKTGLQIFKNNTWKQTVGGWLSTSEGTWDQLPEGLYLNKKGEHGGNVAELQGLNFTLSSKGDTGNANYPNLGDSGTWTVVAEAGKKSKTTK